MSSDIETTTFGAGPGCLVMAVVLAALLAVPALAFLRAQDVDTASEPRRRITGRLDLGGFALPPGAACVPCVRGMPNPEQGTLQPDGRFEVRLGPKDDPDGPLGILFGGRLPLVGGRRWAPPVRGWPPTMFEGADAHMVSVSGGDRGLMVPLRRNVEGDLVLRVVEASGQPVVDARVRISFLADTTEVRTDDQGTARFPGIPSRTWHVVVRASGAELHAEDMLGAGTWEATLALRPARRVRVRMAGAPATALLFIQHLGAWGAETGEFTGWVPGEDGSTEVTVSPFWNPVRISLVQTTDVDADAQRLGTFRTKVLGDGILTRDADVLELRPRGR